MSYWDAVPLALTLVGGVGYGGITLFKYATGSPTLDVVRSAVLALLFSSWFGVFFLYTVLRLYLNAVSDIGELDQVVAADVMSDAAASPAGMLEQMGEEQAEEILDAMGIEPESGKE